VDARKADLAFVVILGSSLAVTVALASATISWSSLELLSGIILVCIWIGAFIFFVASFFVRFGLVELPISAERAPSFVASWLRRMGHRVSDEDDALVVMVDSICSVKLTFKQSDNGTLVRAQAWASPTGWSITLIAMFMWLFSAVAMVTTAYIFLKSMHHSVDKLALVISRLDEEAYASKELDIRSALLEGLSEARRLASEAYEGTRSNYQDAMLLVAVGSVIVFTASMAAAMWGYFNALLEPASVRDVLAISLVPTAIFTTVVVWLVRVRYREILPRLKDWKVDLDVAFQMEVNRVAPLDSQRSAVEIMADAWKELPTWLHARRKSSTYREPGTWLVIFALASASWWSLMGGVMMLAEGSVRGIYPLIAGSGMIAGAVYLYVRWMRKRGAEDSRTEREWNERSRMLEELLGRQFQGS